MRATVAIQPVLRRFYVFYDVLLLLSLLCRIFGAAYVIGRLSACVCVCVCVSVCVQVDQNAIFFALCLPKNHVERIQSARRFQNHCSFSSMIVSPSTEIDLNAVVGHFNMRVDGFTK